MHISISMNCMHTHNTHGISQYYGKDWGHALSTSYQQIFIHQNDRVIAREHGVCLCVGGGGGGGGGVHAMHYVRWRQKVLCCFVVIWGVG